MSGKAALLLAEGFEEIEALGTVDILRRAEVSVKTASISAEKSVTSSHDITVQADCTLSELNADELSLIVLPGGMPGSRYLAESQDVLDTVTNVYNRGDYVAAICAAPLALNAAGLLDGKTITAYPKIREQLSGCTYTGKSVEQDGTLITGKGPGAVFAFAMRIVSLLCGAQQAQTLIEGMVIPSGAVE